MSKAAYNLSRHFRAALAIKSSGVRTSAPCGISRHLYCTSGSGLHIATAIAIRISFRTSSTVVLCLRATSNSAVSALMFFLFMVSLLAILNGCRSYRTTIAQRFRGKSSNAVEKKQRSAKSKPLYRCYRNSSTKVSSTFITLRCPSGDSVFNRSESSVA